MAVTARFVADFASFEKAVKGATSSLNLWETELKKVERSMKALDNAFSGRDIIQGATQAAAAVEKIGGATKLTEAEQKRLNATVTEALAKYKALGLEAPKNLIDLEKATRGLSDSTSAAGKTTGILASAFGQFTAANLAASAIQNVVGKIGEFIATGQKLPGIERSFVVLSGTVKQSSAEMLSSMQVATRGLVSNFDLMQSANKAILLGLPVTAGEMGDLAKSATALGRAMGLDATQSLNDLITALGRSSPLILDNLGLTVKVGDANEAYAKSLGTTVGALTEADKKMAFYRAAMEAARQKTKELGEQTLTLSELVQRAWTMLGNDVTKGASIFNKVVGAMISDGQHLKTFFEGFLKGGMLQAIDELNTELDKLDQRAAMPRGSKYRTAKGVKEDEDFIKSLAAMDAKLKLLTATEKAQIAAARELGRDMGEVAKKYDLTERHLDRLAATTKEITRDNKSAAEAMKAHAQVVLDAYDATRRAAVSYYGLIQKANMDGIGGIRLHGDVTASVLTAEITKWLELRKTIDGIKVVQGLDNLTLPGGFKIGELGANLIPDVVKPFRDAFTAFGQELPKIIFGTLQSGGSVVGAVASGLAVAFSMQFQKELQKVGGNLQQLGASGKLLGTAGVGLSSFVGGFDIGSGTTSKTKGALGGAAAGALAGLPLAGPTMGLSVAVGALAGALGGLFGASKKAKEELAKLRQVQLDLVKHFGGMAKLQMAAEDTGVAIGNALTTKNAAEFERFVTRLNEKLAFQKERWDSIAPIIGNIQQLGGRLPESFQGYIDKLGQAKLLSSENLDVLKKLTGEGEMDWQRLQSVAEKYGISLDGLGDRFQAAKLSAGAQQIWDDFQLLIGSGADTNAVLAGMADEISNLVKNSIKFGVAIPENFKPLIEQLMKSGKLLDENGEAIKDLSTLKFSDTIQTSIEKLVTKLDELLERILAIPGAIAKIPRDIELEVDLKARGDRAELNIPHLASGGIATRPTLAMIGERGPEAVIPLSRMANTSSTKQIINIHLDGERIASQTVRHMPQVLDVFGV